MIQISQKYILNMFLSNNLHIIDLEYLSRDVRNIKIGLQMAKYLQKCSRNFWLFFVPSL